MPIKKSAKKYVKVTASKNLFNKKISGVFKNAIKKTREAVVAGKTNEAEKWLKNSIKALDKAAQKGILKKNTVARKKSRLNKLVKKLVLKETNTQTSKSN